MKFLLTILFSLSCLVLSAQSNPSITVSPFSTDKHVQITVKKEDKYPPYLYIGTSPYGEWLQSQWEETDSTWITYITFRYIPFEPDTIKILAKDFLATGGTIADVGNAMGNIGAKVENTNTVGFFNTGDWLKYSINLTGKKEIKFRYSYGATAIDRKLEIRIGSISGTLLAEMQSQPTGNWNTFIDKMIPINADTSSLGMQDIFFVVTGTPGATNYWGNLTDSILIY